VARQRIRLALADRRGDLAVVYGRTFAAAFAGYCNLVGQYPKASETKVPDEFAIHCTTCSAKGLGEDWRIWKIGKSDGSVPALNVVLGAASLASVFSTPPRAVGSSAQALADYQMGFDFERDAARIYATDAQFHTSGWDDIGARSAALSAFRERGGRMIVPHGDSDPVFSLNDTLNWYREVDADTHGVAASFVRVFPVPGMCHCFGGQATDRYDAFAALVQWVEKHAAPDYLLATAGPNSPWPGRARPVCAYPAVARYKGRGSPEKASSFQCKV
jgi:hypothetical protein